MRMDPGIWSQLPQDILDQVLLFLPLKTYMKLRSTNKHVNSLMFSPCFISRHALSSLSSFIILSHSHFQQKCRIFNTSTNSWCNTPLPLPTTLSSLTLLSSSNRGLLCFSNLKSSCFMIYNPISRSSHTMNFPICPLNFELLTLVSVSNGHYKLFMLTSSNKVFVYDSMTNSWIDSNDLNGTISTSYHQKGAYYGKCLFFTTSEPFNVVGFDLESGKWERLLGLLPNRLTFGRLVSDEEGKKLYLIGGVGEIGISTSIKVWEYLSEDWVEVEIMPEMVVRKFVSVCYHNYEHVYCFWHNGLIYVCCSTWPEILYYKMSRRTWYWLPKCPLLPEKWSCGFKWFPFKPALYASA